MLARFACTLLLMWSQSPTFTQGDQPAQSKAEPQKPDADVPRIKVDRDTMGKFFVHHVVPVYPPLALQAHRTGTVKLHVIVGVDGAVKSVDLISGPPIFVQSATDAVRQWKYKPPTAGGKPVEVDTTADVTYSLKP